MAAASWGIHTGDESKLNGRIVIHFHGVEIHVLFFPCAHRQKTHCESKQGKWLWFRTSPNIQAMLLPCNTENERYFTDRHLRECATSWREVRTVASSMFCALWLCTLYRSTVLILSTSTCSHVSSDLGTRSSPSSLKSEKQVLQLLSVVKLTETTKMNHVCFFYFKLLGRNIPASECFSWSWTQTLNSTCCPSLFSWWGDAWPRAPDPVSASRTTAACGTRSDPASRCAWRGTSPSSDPKTQSSHFKHRYRNIFSKQRLVLAIWVWKRYFPLFTRQCDYK